MFCRNQWVRISIKNLSRSLPPKQLLKMGVFGGKYMTGCKEEFPDDWYKNAKLCHKFHDPKLNYFGINASKPLSYRKKQRQALLHWAYDSRKL